MFTINKAGTPSEKMAHPCKSLPLSSVVIRTLGRCGYLALGFGKRKLDAGLQACVLLGMLPGTRVGGSGGRHEADSPFHAIKVSRFSMVRRC